MKLTFLFQCETPYQLRWIAIKFRPNLDIHIPHIMNPTDWRSSDFSLSFSIKSLSVSPILYILRKFYDIFFGFSCTNKHISIHDKLISEPGKNYQHFSTDRMCCSVAISQMLLDCSEFLQLRFNPLFAGAKPRLFDSTSAS